MTGTGINRQGRRKTVLRLQLAGGLGNQLFQIVAGRYYSQRWGMPLKIDALQLTKLLSPHNSTVSSLRLIDRSEIRYGPFLQVWFFTMELARHLKIKPTLIQNLEGKIEDALGIYRSLLGGYDPNLEHIQVRPRVLVGFFQSWKYPDFLLRSNPSFKSSISLRRPSPWFEQLSREAIAIQPISIHIRRGDYRVASKVFGLLGKRYYQLAIQRMKDLQPNREFWVFSDEPDSALQILSTDTGVKFRVIRPPLGSDPAETLLLMSMCSGHIVANSSFSWWGAFLGSGGPVIAPDEWFLGSPEPEDLIPPYWHRIPSNFED
jgi:hypothetical protein